jgi:predicted Zn-dependent protease
MVRLSLQESGRLEAYPTTREVRMNSQNLRRQQIESMLHADPQDRFLRYCLAVEMHVDGDSEKSLAKFDELCREVPPHVAAFFRRAQLLVELDRIEEARSVLREGIEVARAQDDLHAAGEMSELLADLGQWGE